MKKILLSSLVAASLLSSALVAKEYTLDKTHTNVGFKIKHLQISNVRGNFTDYDGLVDYDAQSGEFKKLEAKIKVASVDTDNKSRDDHLQQDDFFKAKTYPEITFVMKKFDKNTKKMTGTLSIAGVSKDITLDTDVGGVAQAQGKEKLGFSLNGVIKRSDFKFAPSSSTVALGDEVELNIEVEANAK